ncbi:uncharacterized protein [Cicer arietinum]|uniref:Uncharacterized protein LOC101491481 isoform X1 n=2 Tax=Cicer arietinum TaxID=3827 RepID=A0A1S3EBZ6_CICAR|nr:uncharacterized protein LOC101491481 isoform X1 [Cicer arietinum]
MDTKRSPEFEFCMLHSSKPNILPADQLFLHGLILPLHLLSTQNKPHHHSSPSIPDSTSITTTTTPSHRWKDIFIKKKKTNNAEDKLKKKDKRLFRKGVSTSPELNINIWPFSRSSSAGNSVIRPKSVTRRVNSAPCSRSNSAGDSKSRKWPSSPGVHLARSSPIWQGRRGGSGVKKTEAMYLKQRRSRVGSTGCGGGIPMCRSEVKSTVSGKLRTFFTKKTVLTSH